MSQEIIETINNLARSTRHEVSSDAQVRRAFLLGLWYRSFPLYTLKHLTHCYAWDLNKIDKGTLGLFDIEEVYPNCLKFQFISETGDSWHQCYRDFRERGWHRLKVWREGGRLQYLFKLSIDDLLEGEGKGIVEYPQGFDQLHLLLDISISTCKQVQVGTRTETVPVYETRCTDLAELPEGEDEDAVPVYNDPGDLPTPDQIREVEDDLNL